MNKFIKELQRRNVIKAALSYIVIAWATLQASDIIFPIIGLSKAALRYILIALIVGFPLWIIFAYIFEWTPKGFKKTEDVAPDESVHKDTSKRLNKYIVVGMALAIALLLSDRIFNLTGQDAVQDKSVAVLPFENMNSDADAYFAEGVAQDILTHLAKIGDLRVLSSFTMKDYDPSGKTVQQIGKELGVGFLLTGSIRRENDDLRISCHLVQVNPEKETWAENFDKRMKDVFTIQSEVAKEVALYLQAELLPEEADRINKKPTENLEAYNLYLQGNDFYNNGTSEDNEVAIRLYSKALELDSEFSLAMSGLISAYSRSVANYGDRSFSFFDSTFVLAEKAMEMDPESAEALDNMAYQYLIKGDYVKAIELSKKAVSIKPNSASSHNVLGLLYRNEGRIDEAIDEFMIGSSLEPTKVDVYHYNLGSCYEILGLYDEAKKWYESVLKVDKAKLITLERVAAVGLASGHTESTNSAIDALQEEGSIVKALDLASYFSLAAAQPDEVVNGHLKSLVNHPDFTYLDQYLGTMSLAYMLKKQGMQDSLNAVLNDFYEAYESKWGTVHDDGDVYIPFVQVEMLRGNRDKALKWVEKIVATGSLWAYQTMHYDPIISPLKKEPEFQSLISPLRQRVERLRMNVQSKEQSLSVD